MWAREVLNLRVGYWADDPKGIHDQDPGLEECHMALITGRNYPCMRKPSEESYCTMRPPEGWTTE